MNKCGPPKVNITLRLRWYAKAVFAVGFVAVYFGADPDKVASWTVRNALWLSVEA